MLKGNLNGFIQTNNLKNDIVKVVDNIINRFIYKSFK